MIRGLLLAGGAATRFGSAKLLHPYEGATLGEVSARHLIEGVGNALAVVREGDTALAAKLRAAGCEVLLSARSLEGLGGSLAAGVAATAQASGWVVALADMPRVSAACSRSVRAALEAGALIAAPTLASGERGHPVGFAARLGAELAALGGDEGARALLARHRDAFVAIPTDDRGILYDIDCPADL